MENKNPPKRLDRISSDPAEVKCFEETRRCLLRMYHSNIQTHAGYLLAIIVASVTLIVNWENFFPSIEKTLLFWTQFVFYGLVISIIGFTFYVLQRMLYWNAFNNVVLTLTIPETINYLEKYIERHSDLRNITIKPYTRAFQLAAKARLTDIHESEESGRSKHTLLAVTKKVKWWLLFVISISTLIFVIFDFLLRKIIF